MVVRSLFFSDIFLLVHCVISDSPKKQKIIEKINHALKDLVDLGLDNAHILDLVKNKLDDIRQ